MPFSSTRLDEGATKRLVALYRRSVDNMLTEFDSVSDFGRANRLALIANINKELNRLGVDTSDWISKEITAAYSSGMNAAIDGLSKVDGYKVFYHGSGGRLLIPGNNMFGSGFYITDDPKIAAQFGKVKKIYLNIFDPNQILRINNQEEYTKFVTTAIGKYPGMDAQKAMPKYASSLGYKAILGAKDFDPLAGINVLDKSLMTPRPLIPVKTLFTQPNKLQVKALIDDTSKSFADALTLVGRNVQSITTKAFQREVRAKIAEGVVTSQTRLEIVASIKDQLRSRGLTALTDRGGKNWTLDRYADMLARTKLTEARNSGLATKMLENNQDLVQVSINGSDHEACAVWEGKILSMSGKTSGFDTVDTAEAEGLWHPNCKHTINPIDTDLAAKTFGWDRNAGDYKEAVFDDKPLGGRVEDKKQTLIENLLNKGDTQGASEVIATLNHPGLKKSLESMMKYYK